MQNPAELATSIPDLARSVDKQALAIWLERQGLTLAQLHPERGRTAYQVEARRLVAEFLRRRGWSYPLIAELIGYADHTTVLHLLRSRRAS